MKIFEIVIIALIVAIAVSVSAVIADIGDEATLGSIDTSGNYRWRVESDGDLIPGTTTTYDIGSSTNKVDQVYCDDITVSTSVSVLGGALTASGTNLYWKGIKLTN